MRKLILRASVVNVGGNVSKEVVLDETKTVCVDFDDTLCLDNKLGPPCQSLLDFIAKNYKEIDYVIYSARSPIKDGVVNTTIEEWLAKHKISRYFKKIIYGKPKALFYIDDKACVWDIKK